MSIASDILAQGNSVLLGIAGEALTIRGQSVTGLINQLPRETWRDGTQDTKAPFLPQNMATIELTDSALNPVPQPGEVFTDSNGRGYRVQESQRRGFTTMCLCKSLGNG